MELNEISLNRQERKLLKKINFLTHNGKLRIVQTDKLMNEPEFNRYYFYQLRKLGLVETHHFPDPNEKAHYRPENGFCSTEDGLHYFDWHWEHLRQFMYRSVLVPIFVSIIANIVIYLIKQL